MLNKKVGTSHGNVWNFFAILIDEEDNTWRDYEAELVEHKSKRPKPKIIRKFLEEAQKLTEPSPNQGRPNQVTSFAEPLEDVLPRRRNIYGFVPPRNLLPHLNQ